MSTVVPPRLVSIVEGDGEVGAIPILVRRIAEVVDPTSYVDCPRPIRVPRGKLIAKPDEMERAVRLARLEAGESGAILVVLDSDGDPPCQLGPNLHRRVKTFAGDMDTGVVVAHREFEAWFLAAAESLRGHRGLPADLVGPPYPESIADAKRWLRERMPPGRRYRETADQPALAAIFDLQAARRAGSFDKFYREVERLVHSLTGNVGVE